MALKQSSLFGAQLSYKKLAHKLQMSLSEYFFLILFKILEITWACLFSKKWNEIDVGSNSMAGNFTWCVRLVGPYE